MDKLQSLDWRGLYKSAKNSVKKYSLNLTDLEVKVEDATSNETWGPHGSVMTGALGEWQALSWWQALSKV